MGRYIYNKKLCDTRRNLSLAYVYVGPDEEFNRKSLKQDLEEGNYHEIFADLLSAFLLCDEYNLPENDPRFANKFQEFINLLKKYEFIY